MCGIAGKIDFVNKVDEALLGKMSDVLRHRGPDDKGIWSDNNGSPSAGLAHSRLSIIDLETGKQPMSNEDGSLWIVHNGEVYNFQDLRNKLAAKGHIFRTKSDTEVLLHLYEEKKEEMVKDLRGMFAFAIWDRKDKRLFVARDRIGKKPFNYYYDGRKFIFGSEIKAITEDPSIKKEVNHNAMDYYLTYGYTPLGGSIYKGIKKLPAAHYMILDKNGLTITKYWELRYEPKLIKNKIEDYEDELLSVIKEAVAIRMVADVPLGVFLSGGVDSSLVTALMSMSTSKKVKTFTIGFDYEDYSEIKYARKVAEHLGTEHHEFIVRPDALKILDKLIWHYNEPYGDSSCLPSFYVAQKTGEFVKVALNGDGGDESFAGYDRYKGAKLSMILNGLPPALFRAGEKALSATNNFIKGKKKDFITRRINFLQAMSRYPAFSQRYSYWMGYFTASEKTDLYDNDFAVTLSMDKNNSWLAERIEGSSNITDIVDRMMKTDIETNLLGDLLVKMDIACMANSIEGRSPLLDHKVMEFAAALPPRLKLNGLESKFILKRIASRFVPKEVLYRKKMGFGVPISQWFKDEMNSYVSEVLLDDRSLKRRYFRKGALEKILNEHKSGKKDNKYKIWALLNLELWHRIFVD